MYVPVCVHNENKTRIHFEKVCSIVLPVVKNSTGKLFQSYNSLVEAVWQNLFVWQIALVPWDILSSCPKPIEALMNINDSLSLSGM